MKNNNNILTSAEYLKAQKNNVIDNEKFKTFCKNHKQANEKTKNYVSINKQATLFVQGVALKKTTNNDLKFLVVFAKYLLKNTSDFNLLESLVKDDSLKLKKILTEIYNKTLKLGVVTTNNENKIERKLDLKYATGVATLKTMFLIMFSEKYTYIKPPKKEKQKKTLKKSSK